MSQHAQKLLADVDQKIAFHVEQLQKLNNFRANLVEFCDIDPTRPDDSIKNATSAPSPATPVSWQAAPEKRSDARPKAARPAGHRNIENIENIENRDHSPDAGKMVRKGRLGQTDRARAIILALPGKFTHDDALAAIKQAGLPFKKAYTLLGSLIKARKLDKFSASEYFVPGRNATTAAAMVAKPKSPAKRGGHNINAPLRENILNYLATASAPVKLKQIASDLKGKANAIRQVLVRMIKERTVVKAAHGRYGLAATSQREKSKAAVVASVPNPSDYVPPSAARDNELPPAPGSVSDILARHNVLIEDMDPFHPGAIEIGLTFKGDFTLTDAQARIGRKQAGYWLARWKESGWIETVGFSTYRRTATFGQKP